MVHPECPREVFELADESGSTGKIIATVEAAAPGTTPTLPPLQPRTEHPKLPFEAAAGALVIRSLGLALVLLPVAASARSGMPASRQG